MIILSILLILFGLLMIVRPGAIWTITENWKSNDATEPSNLYILSTRLGGVMFTLAGVGGIVVNSFV